MYENEFGQRLFIDLEILKTVMNFSDSYLCNHAMHIHKLKYAHALLQCVGVQLAK